MPDHQPLIHVAGLERQRYLRVDDAVLRVGAAAVRAVKSDWTGYASPRLVPAGARLTRLELPEVTLARKEKGRWRAVAGGELEGARAGAAARAWRKRRALSVKPASGDDGPEAKAVLHLAGREEPLRYAVHRGDSRVTLRRGDLGVAYELMQRRARELLYPGRADKTQGDGAAGKGSAG